MGDLVPLLEHLFPSDAPFSYDKVRRMTEYAMNQGFVAYENTDQTQSRRLVLTIYRD